MSDPTQGADAAENDFEVARRDPELQALFESLRALNSAWSVLAPFGFSDEGRHIVATGRALREELVELADQPFEERDRSAFPRIQKLLEAVENDMRTLAFEVPVAQLRSELPARLRGEREGLLDLLDLMLVSEIEEFDGSAGRISAIDYLITLLCTGAAGDEDAPLDPVGLTPRLHALCERAEWDDSEGLEAIAAEFRAAADVCEEEALEEVQLRALRRRKRELGGSYFAPDVLRAVVAYNAALSRCIADGVWDSRDWGSLPAAGEPGAGGTSVFGTEALPLLAEALRRRARGREATTSALDRVAWCLDLDGLDPADRSALLAPGTGRTEGLAGTVALVGLLHRSAAVLEGEFEAIGIPPDALRSDWLRELEAVLRREVNQGLAGDAYNEARRLSDVRTRFLGIVSGDSRPPPPPPPPRTRPAQAPPVPKRPSAKQEARQLVGEALDRQDEPAARRRFAPWHGESRTRLAGLAALGVALALGAWALLGGGDLDRMGRAELERVSPYLTEGTRNGEGAGPAFVGRLHDGWSALERPEQEHAALDLVSALRAQGVREVMVYDAAGRLRIQALGERHVQVLPAPGK